MKCSYFEFQGKKKKKRQTWWRKGSCSRMPWKPPVIMTSQPEGWKASSEPFGLICQTWEGVPFLAPRGWSCLWACLPSDGQPITVEWEPCPLLGRPNSSQDSSSLLLAPVSPISHPLDLTQLALGWQHCQETKTKPPRTRPNAPLSKTLLPEVQSTPKERLLCSVNKFDWRIGSG